VPVQVSNLTGVTAVAAGAYHGMALKSDSSVWAWGYNVDGQLGNNSTADSHVPVTTLGLAKTTVLAAGEYHSLAVRATGMVWAWGSNADGQLGNNSTIDSSTPVPVSGLTGATSVAGGALHSLVVKSDGTVWAWGFNNHGQLGNNSTTLSTVPVQVSGLTGATAVAGGTSHSVALKSDGTVWTWGMNTQGQLGNNSTTDSLVPVQVSGLTGVVAVAAGSNHTLALKSDGTVWAWGYNNHGQLGNNSTVNSLVPVQVSGLSGVSALSSGWFYSLALKSDGTVWAWGMNTQGQLGNNSTTDSLVPVQTSGLSGVASVAGSGYDALALKTDGTVWAWGANTQGELGNNSTTNSSVPVQVNGLAGVTAVAGGSYHALARKYDTTVSAWGYNAYGELDNGTTVDAHVPVATIALAAPPQSATTYGYDSRGNRTSVTLPTGATTTLAYDQANRLTGYGSSATYGYNGDGLRMSKTVSGTTTPFTWDPSGSLPLLLSDGSSSYVYGLGGSPVEQISSSGTVTYLHQDQLGSTRLLTDSTGTVTGTYTFDSFGNITASTGSPTTLLLYAGQYRDAESGLSYLRARYYDPSTAQFLTRDPLAAKTHSPYGYGGDDPVNATDPSGLYEYYTSWDLGPAGNHTPEEAMWYLEHDSNAVFPWQVEGTNGETSLELGHQYSLHTNTLRPCLPPFGCYGPDPVLVINESSTSFTFLGLPGHLEGFGSTITFSTYCQNGHLMLQQHAEGPDSPLEFFDLGVINSLRMQKAQEFWGRMANSLIALLNADQEASGGFF